MVCKINYNRLNIAHTNESLMAIRAGLNIEETDNILTVGGSGDVAFNLLERGPRITVVDNCSMQVKYIRNRANHLLTRRFNQFITFDISGNGYYEEYEAQREQRNSYFKNIENVRKIRENLNNLTVLDTIDILDAEFGGFNKIYFSNALFPFQFKKVADKSGEISEGGLMYFSNGERLFQITQNLDNKIGIHLTERGIEKINKQIFPMFEVERELTIKARSLETVPWTPIIIRKKQQKSL